MHTQHPTGGQQCLGHAAVVVGQNVLKPIPLRLRVISKHLEEARTQFLSHRPSIPRPCETGQNVSGPQGCEGHGTRRLELQRRLQRLVEQPRGKSQNRVARRVTDHVAQSLQSSALRIFTPHFFQPLPIVGHQVPESPFFGIVRESQKGQIPVQKRQDLGIPAEFPVHRSHDSGTSVVVRAVPEVRIGYGVDGMLQNPRIIRENPQVPQIDLRQTGIRDRLGANECPRRLPAVDLHRAVQDPQILAAHLSPDHLAPELVGVLPDAVASVLVPQQFQQGFTQRFLIPEGNQDATFIGEHLFGVVVRRRNDRLARGNGVRQRSGDDLLLRQVGRHVDVGSDQETQQLFQRHVLIAEDHMFLKAEPFDESHQRETIFFAVDFFHLRVSRPEDHVGDVGKLFHHAR